MSKRNHTRLLVNYFVGLVEGIGSSLANFENDKIKVGIRHLWATDIDPDSCKTYEKNITHYESEQLGINEKVDVKIADVNDKTIDLTDANQFPYVDGLLFGFPCNDFSIVGESKGLSGKFGPLYKHGIKVLNRDDTKMVFSRECGRFE